METKLTKAQFATMVVGTHFLYALHNKTLQEVKDHISEVKELPYIYKVEACKLRSKDFVMKTSKGENSFRDFYGKNEFIKYDDLLIHINIQHGHTTVFLNL